MICLFILKIKYAKILIEYGASKENGKKIYECRYGVPNLNEVENEDESDQLWYSFYSLLL